MSPLVETREILDEIRTLFAEKGNDMYAGEPVSQTEHALQAASAAELEQASPELITAALLHDDRAAAAAFGADRGQIQ